MENNKGFYKKYNVNKISGDDPEDAWYFVLRADEKCKNRRYLNASIKALKSYAKAIKRVNSKLSSDIFEQIDKINPPALIEEADKLPILTFDVLQELDRNKIYKCYIKDKKCLLKQYRREIYFRDKLTIYNGWHLLIEAEEPLWIDDSSWWIVCICEDNNAKEIKIDIDNTLELKDLIKKD
jgi:hypothetical protein